jgi:hypothetical protein
MTPIVLRILVRLVLCAVASYFMWRRWGPTGLAISAPLFGVALARPIIDLVAEFSVMAKRAALGDLEGRNFEFRGQRLDVAEHDDGHRWISVRDLRKVLHAFPRDAVLRAQFPAEVRHDPALRGERIRADAVLTHLRKATETDAIKFRNWIERDVIFPAARARGEAESRHAGHLPGSRSD